MRRTTTARAAIAVTALIAIGLVSAAMAPAAPEQADPATPDEGYYPNASLARSEQLSTVATGSTAGFEADETFVGQATAAGATGWWSLGYRRGTSFSIDSCGSSYPVAMTVYEVFARTDNLTVVDSTADACADPVEGRYFGGRLNSGPDGVRIDDPSGAGGDYVVHYDRTPVDVAVEIRRFAIGKVSPLERGRRAGEATVTAKVHVDSEPTPKLKCTLDGRRIRPCSPDLGKVRSGKHEYRVTVRDRFGNKASDRKSFKVPYLH